MDIFPYGATLVSTMTRWGQGRPTIEEWTNQNVFDLRSMARYGMTSVGVMMDWELVEPEEGKFDFTWHDVIMNEAAALGLKVVLWPWEQVCPEWVARDHADWLWEADDGTRPPYGCWHHPVFQNRVHRFLRMTVERYRDNPSTLQWNVAIEPHYRITWFCERLGEWGKLYCYQPATVTKFIDWLKRKYANDIQRLNCQWYSFFTDWSQVEPPRFGRHHFNSARFYDWRLFWIDALAEYQHAKGKLVKSLDPRHETTGNSGWFPDPIYAGLGMHKVAAGFDSWGISLFPVYRGGRSSPVSNSLSYDYVRSSCHPGRPAYVHELQGGPMAHGMVYGETPNPGDIRQWSWQAVGKGFRGIWFWVWRPHRAATELGGFGLSEMDGSDTDRIRAAEETSRKLQRYAPVINRLNAVQPEVGIVYSDLNTIFAAIASQLTNEPHAHELHHGSLEGYYETLYKIRIPVHILIDEQLKELVDGNLRHLKALIIPYLPMIDQANLAVLEQFVRRGGMIWTDPWLGQRTTANVSRDAVPGGGLKDLFGCVQRDVRPIVPDNPQNRRNAWRGGARVGGGTCTVRLQNGEPVELKSLMHEVPLEPLAGGEVLGTFEDGAPALVRKVENGSSVYLAGSFFGMSAKQTSVAKGFDEQKADLDAGSILRRSESGLTSVFKHILARESILPPIEAVGQDQPEVEAHLLTGENEAMAVFLNLGPDPMSGTWRIRLGFKPDSKLSSRDIVSDQPVNVVGRTGESLDVELCLPRYGIAVIHLTV